MGYRKKVKGRKRSILVDTLGSIWKIHVHSGDLKDAAGAVPLLTKLKPYYRKKLNKILGDAAYVFPFDYIAETDYGIRVEIKKRERVRINDREKRRELVKKNSKEMLTPLRWIVERTFAWLILYRRLSRDFEKNPLHSESMVYVSMIQLTLKKLGDSFILYFLLKNGQFPCPAILKIGLPRQAPADELSSGLPASVT